MRGGELVRDDVLDLCRVGSREVVDGRDADLLEETLGRGPALLEHVDAGQDAQRDDLVALLEVVDEEVGRLDAPRKSTDGVDERRRAVGVDTTV
ncbi:hypothetical protein IE160_03935 [Chryseoglobus sp. 28M-23]|nr:hypothetical protein IE160_03935 [Chryseoglobus sp. 28M-23]